MIRKVTILLASISIVSFGYSQKNELPKNMYEYTGENVKDYCWSNTDERYERTDIPEEYENESAVILLSETIYESKARTNRYLSYLSHYRIKLLDQAALDDFSEIFNSDYRHGFYTYYRREKKYLEIKIIKPDSSEIVLDDIEYIEDDGKKKVAIPGLEIGDILDFYLFTYDFISGSYNSNVIAVFDKETITSRYPILLCKYKLITDDDWKVYFTTGEKGPDIVESRTGHKNRDYQFYIEQEYIPRRKSELWNLAYRSEPYIKLLVSYNKGYLSEQYPGDTLRIDGLSNKVILSHYEGYYNKSNSAANEYAGFIRYLKRYNKTDISQEEKVEEYYYYLRHHFINMHFLHDNFNDYSEGYTRKSNNSYDFISDDEVYRKLSDELFTSHLIYGLQKLDIPYEIIVSARRDLGALENIFHPEETDYIIKASLGDKAVCFYNPSPFTRYNDFPYKLEGENGYVVHKPEQRGKLSVEKRNLPLSKAEDNQSIAKSNLKIDLDNYEKTEVSTDITLTGFHMASYKQALIDWIEMIWAENEKYGTKKWGNLESANKKFKVQMEEFKNDRDQERKENFESYAKRHFDIDEVELIDYKTNNTGNGPKEYDFNFNFKCTLGGIVKKVGPNYILKLGKLIGSQVTLDEEDMEREVNVYMNYARTFDYSISVEIPEGYDVKGLDNFNVDIDNETGYIKSSAELDGNTLVFKFIKQYKNNIEKAENWPLMKDFLIPASLIPSKEVILKKL